MGQIWHLTGLVGCVKAHTVFDAGHAGVQSARDLGGTGPCQNADHLAGQTGGGVGGAGIEASGIDHLHIGGLGSLVERDIGGIVTVGGDEADGAVARIEPQGLCKRRRDIGDHLQRQNVDGNGISDHGQDLLAKIDAGGLFLQHGLE